MTAAPYPLRLRPILLEKTWGGDRLAAFGKPVPPRARIGESWEVADLGATAPSGAGGGAQRSVIENGALAGATLHEALRAWGRGLLGAAEPTGTGEFPLLIKLLDAREHVSVQVHPSPGYAAQHPGVAIKHEAWLVVEAEPGARIFAGLRHGVGADELRSAVAAGRVRDVLQSVPALPGSCHTLPSGIVHALGAGVVVVEVQTPSDTTFRLYDWVGEYERPCRALHVEEALEAMARIDAPPPRYVPPRPGRTTIAETARFTVEAARLAPGSVASLAPGGATCIVVQVVAGAVRVHAGEALALERGAAAVVPAALVARASLEAGPLGALVVLSSPCAG